MTNLSTSLNNALSGLTALNRMTETISANVANAGNESYGAREAIITQRVNGGVGTGAAVATVVRNVDPVLLAERRLAEAALGQTSERAEFYAAIESIVGLPDDAGSLSARLAQFGADLIEAGSRPDSESRLQAVLASAQSVTSSLNTAADAVQTERMNADRSIAGAVDTLNNALQQLEVLNGQIVRASGPGTLALNLVDERQRVIDQISEYVPVREVTRDNGAVALFTPGGAILFDMTAAEFGFSPAGIITADMSLGGGTLSGLTINGKAVSTSATSGPIAGGRLSGLFDVRDVQAPAVQVRLDATARDLIERFESTTVDPTLTLGDPGLFTDNGAALDATLETGLAGRVSVNALVDPAQGGALWRLRDGLGAATAGAAGDATLINALGDALAESRTPATGGFLGAQTAYGIAGELLGGIAASQTAFASEQSFARARSETLTEQTLVQGVDTDAELQRLLLVEQAFAANARVISTIDELIEQLLRI